jgi:serine protease Do
VVTRGWLGVQIQPITRELADSMGLKVSSGALVRATVKSALEEAAKSGRETVLFLVRSGDAQRFVALPVQNVS